MKNTGDSRRYRRQDKLFLRNASRSKFDAIFGSDMRPLFFDSQSAALLDCSRCERVAGHQRLRSSLMTKVTDVTRHQAQCRFGLCPGDFVVPATPQSDPSLESVSGFDQIAGLVGVVSA